MNVSDVLADLIAEQNALDAIVTDLPPTEWSRATPSPGWTVADQIGHLMYFDGTAALAITDPEAFKATVTALLAGMATGAAGGSDPTLDDARAMAPDELLEAWRVNRTVLDAAAATLAEDTRVVWY